MRDRQASFGSPSAAVGELDHRHLWHPFTQLRDWCREEPLVIERAEGNELIDADGRRYLDGVSSLWCNVHGHRHPLIDEAVRAQLDRVAHSTLLGLTHRGAAELAARLVELAPPGLNRVFYSDSGSTAVEVALKMAFQYWQQRGAAPRGGRASSASRRLPRRHPGRGLGRRHRPLPRALRAAPLPGAPRSSPATPGQLERRARASTREEIAAVIVEPLVQGAAGMRVHPPGLPASRCASSAERHDVLLICDEVATGFGRTGTMFACEQEGVAPDLLCLGKGLTGGYLPLAATLTTERVYEAFLGAPEDGAHLLPRPHLHRQPAGLRRRARQPRRLRARATLLRLQPKIRLLGELLGEVAAMPEVAEVRGRGFMVGIDLGEHDPALRLGHRVALEARERGAIVRPLGDVVVLMPPLTIPKRDLQRLVEIVAALDPGRRSPPPTARRRRPSSPRLPRHTAPRSYRTPWRFTAPDARTVPPLGVLTGGRREHG